MWKEGYTPTNRDKLAAGFLYALLAFMMLVVVYAVVSTHYTSNYLTLDEYNKALTYCKDKKYDGVRPNPYDERLTGVYCAKPVLEDALGRKYYVTEDIK